MSESEAHEVFDHSSPERYRASRRVTLVSVAANLVLTVAQLIVGVIGHSQALVADGLHTLSDLITDFMVLYALKFGKKAADEDHPYGHARIETAVTLILGIVLCGVGVGIAVSAGFQMASAQAFIIPSAMTLWTAAITLVAKETLYRYTMVTAERYDSNMLRASAWHHRSDALSSLIVMAGIGGSLMGFAYLDSAAAMVVALMVGKIGIGLSWQALRELVDTGLATDDLDSIRQAILTVGGVKALHLLRTRRVGGRALVDVHIIVDDKLSVSEGHQISEAVRARLIHEILPVADVMVHIDTEEDTSGATSDTDLPPRAEVLARLARYFKDIPEAKHIERTTLHYLNGRIEVELLLPLAIMPDLDAAKRLTQTFSAACHDLEIEKVEVQFR